MNPEYGMEDFNLMVYQQNMQLADVLVTKKADQFHSRLGELNTGVSSAEQQLQQINQSIEQAQSTLGSAESGGGGASAVTPSVSGYESSGSELYDSSPAGEVTNPYVAPIGMNTKPVLSTGIPPGGGPQLGTLEEQNNQFRDPITGGGQPFYGTGGRPAPEGGLGGLLGESGGGTISNTMAPREPGQPIPDKPLGIYNKGEESFGNIMQATPSIGGGPSLTQTADPAREAYDKLQASVREQRKINPYTRDVLYGERMKFEDFKKSYDAGTDPNQPTYSGPQLQGQLQSSGGGQLLGGGLYNSMNSRKENPLGPVQRISRRRYCRFKTRLCRWNFS